MFKLKTRNNMIEELNKGNVVIGKYMYSEILDVLSFSDDALEYALDSILAKHSGDVAIKSLIDSFQYSEVLSIQDGEYLIPLQSSYMVDSYEKYRSDMKNNDRVLGFAKKINFDELNKNDIAYFYELYQNYKNYQKEEQSKTYQLKR